MVALIYTSFATKGVSHFLHFPANTVIQENLVLSHSTLLHLTGVVHFLQNPLPAKRLQIALLRYSLCYSLEPTLQHPWGMPVPDFLFTVLFGVKRCLIIFIKFLWLLVRRPIYWYDHYSFCFLILRIFAQFLPGHFIYCGGSSWYYCFYSFAGVSCVF